MQKQKQHDKDTFENLKIMAIEDINDPENYWNSVYTTRNYITKGVINLKSLPYVKGIYRFIKSQGHKLIYEYEKRREGQN